MKKGYLIVHVYTDNIAQPVNGATIEIVGENTNLQVVTDQDGKTEKIALDAPDEIYSQTPQHEVKPYSEYMIKVTKKGLKPVIIKGIQIFPDQTAIQNVYLEAETIEMDEPEYIFLPEHVLWGDYLPKIKEAPIKKEYEDMRVLPFVLIPEHIVVHDGIPTNTSVANYTVNFPDYIKNVASNEIYSTWPKETIKANVLAILSFTLNRIFTEWYRSKGYSFTITSSTAYDQKYVHGGTVYQSISNVVDEIFTNYLKLPNVKQPFFAQYNDGIKTNNAGWLSQWGSKDLGDKGYSALGIIQYYYSKNMYIAEAEKIEGLPTSFPGYNLTLGSCGEPVQKIQNELNVINGSYSGIPKVLPANGKFENNMTNTVKIFQEVFDLPVTGIINFATWYKISYVYVAVSKMLKGIYS